MAPRPITINMPKPKKGKGKGKGRGFGKVHIDWKKQAMNAGIGAVVGLAIKYGTMFGAGGNPDIAEAGRRAANVGAAYAGHGTGELAYQIADGIINRAVIIPAGGTPAGGAPGEFA